MNEGGRAEIMNSISNLSGQFFSVALGLYCVIRGIMILTTGKLGAREETGLRGFSEKGIKRYKLFSSFMNICAGLILVVVSALKMLNLIGADIYRIILLVAIIVMVAAYIIIRKSCRNA